MKKKALLFLATGFEELEALGTVDILRRGGVDVQTVSTTNTTEAKGAHGISIVADTTISSLGNELVDALILPGGIPGANNLAESAPLSALIRDHHKAGKLLCAICAAPMVYGKMGLLDGKRATCYPSFETHLRGATYTAEPYTVDGNFITGRGPGFTFDFALCILETLTNTATRQEVAAGMLLS